MSGARPVPAIPGRDPAALTAGVRAFVSREADLIAGALGQAAAAHLAYPPTDALQAVLVRIRALHGLGGAEALTPLPELLEAMELATRALLAGTPPPAGIGAVLADAAAALHAMADAVGRTGRVTLPPELAQVGARLLRGYVAEDDVVPVAALAPEGTESIITRGGLPEHEAGSAPARVELIAVADHLRRQADAIDQAATPVARELRLFVLHRHLSGMPTHGGTGRFLAPLAAALARTIARTATTDPAPLLDALRTTAAFLDRAAEAAEPEGGVAARDALARRLDANVPPPTHAVAEPQDDLTGTPIVPIAALAPDDAADADIVPIAALAPDDAPDAGIVPIAALAPDDAADADIVPIAALAPAPVIPADAPGVPTRLELAYRRRAARGGEPAGAPSLAALLGTPVLDMDALQYDGERALARADEVRAELATILAEPLVSLERIRPHVQELLDLVRLARRVA